MNRPLRLILSLACGLAARASLADAPAKPLTPAETDFFEKRVRPVLVERCYECHSAGAKKLRGHLLLDSRQGWLTGGDGGSSIVPGNPDASLLIKAVRYTDPDSEMPPKGKLPDAEIDALVQWVKMGAPDPRTGEAAAAAPVAAKRTIDIEAGRRHWAYQPLARPAIPAVKNTAWPRTDVDRFVLAKLEAQNLRPAPDADPATLVRRLYFDLVGLPPTPEQVDAYVNDKSADRYERLVDALLASPRFGERWGRHWLDVARFAESLTLRGFVLKDAWRYRDYVIEAFNQDRPFDRFIREQVAGDLLPAASLDEGRRNVVGTAFLAVGNTNLEEQDKKQLEMDIVDEQLDTLGRAFLAQTIGCARCHDHKFDPIPTKDYYALAGILHSTQTVEHSNVSKWLEMPLPTDPEREAAMKKQEAAIAVLQAKLKDAKADAAKHAKAKPAGIVAVTALPGVVVDDAQAKRVGTWTESTSVRGYVGDGYLTDINDRTEEKSLTFLFEVPEPGKYEVRFAYTTGTNRATNVPVLVFSADGERTIAVDEKKAPPIDGHFISLGQYTFEKSGQSFVIVSNMNADGHVTADAVQVLPAVAKDADVATKSTPAKSDAPKDAHADLVKGLEAEIKKLTAAGPKRDTVVSVREAGKPGDTRVHIRGNVHTLGEPAPRGFLQVVSVPDAPAIPADQSGRRELGDWLASPHNPLPPRVMANRVWQWLTGVGIVRTPDNFGTTGELPSDPQLLDHLATGFVAHHYSVKTLIRQIVLSRTYQQSSSTSNQQLATNNSPDPENRLLAHMNRRRLDAESIRDAVLSISGELKLEAGGPTFKPELTSDFNFKQGDVRRSVYLPVFRNALPEIFEAFDFADPSVGTGRRNVSTVAPQALFMLNHPWVKEQAQIAATRLLADPQLTGDPSRLDRAYKLTLGRPPTESERRIALDFLKQSSASPNVAWPQLFHALFASMDFRYED